MKEHIERLERLINQIEWANNMPKTRTSEEIRAELATLKSSALELEESTRTFDLRVQEAVDDAAALRVALTTIRDVARGIEDVGEIYSTDHNLHLRNLLGSIAHKSAEALNESNTGAALSQSRKQMVVAAERWEEEAQRDFGAWRYTGDTLVERIGRVVNHYKRIAERSLHNADTFRRDMLTWMRAMAINADSVSWASTHREKDARLRGLVEVIEAACKKVEEIKADGYAWDGLKDWQRSDYPTRDLTHQIQQMEQELKRLKAQQEGKIDL